MSHFRLKIIVLSALLLGVTGASVYFFLNYQKIKDARHVEILTSNPDLDKVAQNPIQETVKTLVNLFPVETLKELITPEKKDGFTFAIIGDTQYAKPGNPIGGFQQAVKNIKKANPALILHMGDVVGSCEKNDCDSELNQWKSIMGTLFSKTYAVQGNHDRIEGDESEADRSWQNFFNFPTNGPSGYSEFAYSFDYGNAHFVALDSQKPSPHEINGEQRAWLIQDLSRNKKELTFVFFHEPAYPVSSKIGESLDVSGKERDELWKILDQFNVTAVFNGHEHITSRRSINSVHQFVFGNTDAFDHEAPKPGYAEYHFIGQSYGIVEVSGSKVTVKTYTVSGKLLNTFEIKK